MKIKLSKSQWENIGKTAGWFDKKEDPTAGYSTDNTSGFAQGQPKRDINDAVNDAEYKTKTKVVLMNQIKETKDNLAKLKLKQSPDVPQLTQFYNKQLSALQRQLSDLTGMTDNSTLPFGNTTGELGQKILKNLPPR